MKKCLCFAYTTEIGDRGWNEAQGQGYFPNNSKIIWKIILKNGLKNEILT
jgi:hypothetical protein